MISLTIAALGLLGIGSVYLVASHNLQQTVDRELQAQAGGLDRIFVDDHQRPSRFGRHRPPRPAIPPTPRGENAGSVIFRDKNGQYARSSVNERLLPVSAKVPENTEVLLTANIDGQDNRILVINQNGAILQLTRSLHEVNASLDQLRTTLLFIFFAIVALGVLGGYLLSRGIVRPLRSLQSVMEGIRTSGNTSSRLPTTGNDELSQLGDTFNGMLDQIEADAQEREQFVADASHELRTPATVILGNVQLLKDDIGEEERRAIITDLESEARELVTLVNHLLPSEPNDAVVEVNLAKAVTESIGKQQLPDGISITTQLQPILLMATITDVHLVIDNLLSNAAAWAKSIIHVELTQTELSVSNDGPSIDATEVEQIFARFYRSPQARGRNGNGLGLAIARAAAERFEATLECIPLQQGACFKLVFASVD